VGKDSPLKKLLILVVVLGIGAFAASKILGARSDA
jgi:hypothetical protein